MKNVLLRLGAGVFVIFVAWVIYGQCVMLDLSHDEHQFIAPAVLWAREGLLPYRDVPLFHQPYLIWLYALFLNNTTSPLLVARFISGTAGVLTAALLFGCAWFATKEKAPVLRLFAAVSVTLLWLTSYLFLVSAGRTWNHDLPSLCAVSSFALLLFSKNPGRWQWLAAGVLAGLATGGRLTVAPFAGLLPLSALLWTNVPPKVRFSHLAFAGFGVALALAPSAWLYLQDRDAYLFGNFEFPRLPLRDLDNSRILKTIAPWRKLRFFWKEVVLTNLPLVLAILASGTIARVAKIPSKRPVLPLALVALALLAGAFAPSRYEIQHFYVVAPLAALLTAFFLEKARPSTIYTLLGLAFISSILSHQEVFFSVLDLSDREEWTISQVHRQGLALRQQVGPGKILTLAPIVALEGGCSIYPQLATGPFGWRFAHLVPLERRKELGLPSPGDLASLEPPAAVLTGYESEKLERPLVKFAKSHGYQPAPFSDRAILWRKPVP